MSRLLPAIFLAVQVLLVVYVMERVWDDSGVIGDTVDLSLTGGVAPSSLGTLQSGIPLARDRAVAWDPRAKLVLVTQQIDWPFDPPPPGPTSVPPGGWLTYVFTNDAGRALSVEIERYRGNVTRFNETTWPEAPDERSLPIYQLPIPSEAAVIAVEEAAGREFRALCPALRSRSVVTLTKAGAENGDAPNGATPEARGTPHAAQGLLPGTAEFTWMVTYADLGANDSVALIASVDATTGDVLTVADDLEPGATPCGA